MDIRLERFRLACCAAAVLALAGCGGGGGGGSSTPTTTSVSTTVIDGPLKNVTVCLDKNGNGKCDADEVQGKTDASGNVTLILDAGLVLKVYLSRCRKLGLPRPQVVGA